MTSFLCYYHFFQRFASVSHLGNYRQDSFANSKFSFLLLFLHLLFFSSSFLVAFGQEILIVFPSFPFLSFYSLNEYQSFKTLNKGWSPIIGENGLCSTSMTEMTINILITNISSLFHQECTVCVKLGRIGEATIFLLLENFGLEIDFIAQ